MRVKSPTLYQTNTMPTSNRKPARHQEAKRITRLVARSKANWPHEPSLRYLTPTQIEALQEYIAFHKSQQQVAGGYTLFIAILILVSLERGRSLASSLPIIVIVSLMFVTVYYSTVQDSYAVYALTQTNDLRVLPTLILATKHKWGWHPQVRNAILRLLAQVTEEQAGLLNNTAQEQLWIVAIRHHRLPVSNDPTMTLPALRALAAVGNSAMLTRMKQFVARSRRLNVAQEVRSAVQDVIPIMEARIQRQQVPETLLRAADVPTAAPDTLLRPTLAVTPEPAQQLLRASHAFTEDAQA